MHRANAVLASALALALGGAAPPRGERGRFRFDEDNVPGWALMTSAERASHHQRLTTFKKVEECRAYMLEHRTKMEARARERNKVLRPARFDPCDQMKARGLLD